MLLNQLRRLTSEQEQALIRIAIQGTFLAYWLSGPGEFPIGSAPWVSGANYISGAILLGLIILVLAFVWPQHNKFVRAVAIVADAGAVSIGLALTGVNGAPWYGLYLWITLGNGFRYGEKYLYLSGVACLIGFAIMANITPYWLGHRELAIGLAATLVVIPAYSATLIRRLNAAKQRADAASRAKGDFLSRMSHEIRTPLNGILGMTDLLRTRPLEPQDMGYVETIYASGKTLAHQIDEILDLSKIEAGQMGLEDIEFDLYALLNTTLRIFAPQVNAKNLQLQESIDPNTPFLINGDPHRLRQIIVNLVGNAIKFTEKGFITLRVHPREQQDNRVTLRFEVADTGMGIAADSLGLIFQPFTQAESSVSRQHGGTGLGTTICKHLVELMGGEIGVQSTPGVGTTFWFDIPFEVSKPQAEDIDYAWARECRVIYLPDASETRSPVLSMLQDWGMPVTELDSLQQADRLIAGEASDRCPCDALVIDGLAYSDEIEGVLATLARKPFGQTTSLVLLGGENYPPEFSHRDHDQLFVLHRPVDKRVLFNTLHACYSRHSTEDDIIHIARKQVKQQKPVKALNILIADDNATNRLVLQRMLQTLGHRCASVTGGEDVLHELENERYDVAIVDKNMPDMNGIDVFTTYAMAHGGRVSTEFVILTADATAESRASCMAAGIEFFLTKPVSLTTLHETLTRAAPGEGRFEQHVGSSAEPAPQQMTPALVIDDEAFDKLVRLGGEDKNFIREMIANFENDAHRDLRGLEVAVADHDRVAFTDCAHALKGAAMYLGLAELSRLSMVAQNLSQEEFEWSGIRQIQVLRQATDTAVRALHNKLKAARIM